MGRTIILIHGRSPKPPRAALRRLWIDGLRAGLKRDHPRTLRKLGDARIEFIYYGDVSNAFFDARGTPTPDDSASRRDTLEQLRGHARRDFFDEGIYNGLPGKTAMKEFLADVFAGPLALLGVSQPLIEHVAPDMREYWNFDSRFGSDVRYPAIAPLKRAMARDDRIMIVAHSLGSLIAWDTLWKFSRTGEYRPRYTDIKVDLLVTLGSPLGDETVKGRLKGARASGARRYPSNLRRWVNLAAEDDFICHDQNVANDYAEMCDHGLVDEIQDVRIFNLAVRDGFSNPHHGVGYLIHPEMADVLAGWL